MTVAVGSYTWDQYLNELQIYREAMAETPDKYIFVRSVRDIEAAHIQGKTAVIWNTQTSTIIDGGYMVDAFKAGADGCGELAKILPAITDELRKRGYTNEDLAKIYGGNKMRVYQQVWKAVSPTEFRADMKDRIELRNELRQRYISR